MGNQTVDAREVKTQHPSNADAEIDLVEVFYLMWQNLWKILLCLFAGAAAAFAFTYFLITPTYKASASIYIVSASNNSLVNLTDLQLGTQLTKDYQELLVSRPLLEDVIANLSLPSDYKALEGQVSITNTSDTRILKITVTDTDPQRAHNLTAACGLVMASELRACGVDFTFAPCLDLDYGQSAVIGKAAPSYSKNTMLGGMLGAVICCGILLVRYLLNDTFMTPDDLVKYLGVQPLATIPEADLGDFNRMEKHRQKRKKKEAER